MHLISYFLSFIITITPNSFFKCDGDILNAKIINNENGDFSEVSDLKKIDNGAFVLLNWRVDLMLPRTFIANEISFSDNKWKWIYENINQPRLLERLNSDKIKEYSCKSIEINSLEESKQND